MGDKPAERFAPVVVAAALEASADDTGRVNDVILTVASYGRRLPSAAQVRYAELAALEIEKADLGPSGWAERRIQTCMAESVVEIAQTVLGGRWGVIAGKPGSFQNPNSWALYASQSTLGTSSARWWM
jgi:hypothetical protein